MGILAWETQIFKENPPKITNSSVVDFFCQPAATATVLLYLQPAVNRQPGSPRENREAEEKNIAICMPKHLTCIHFARKNHFQDPKKNHFFLHFFRQFSQPVLTR